MCYYHQHASLLVCLSLLSVCVSVKPQWMIQVKGIYRATLEFKSSLSNNLNYDSSLSLSVSAKVIPKFLIQGSVVASDQCFRV